jgi:hypothetical protein
MTGNDRAISRRRALSSIGLGAAATAAGLAAGGHPARAATPADDPNEGAPRTPFTSRTAADELVLASVATVPGLTYYGVNYADFFPYANTTTKVVSPGTGTYGTGGSLIASSDLPHGSFIYDMTVWGGAGGHVSLRRANAGTYSWDTLADVVLPAGSGIVTGTERAKAGTPPLPTLIRVDRSQASYHLQAFSASAATAILDVRVGYIGSASFIPITPTRVYDSREPGGGGKLGVNAVRNVSVANAIASFGGASDVVPAGATAIAYNLTVANTTGSGFLAVYDYGGTFSASTVNWFASGQLLANAGVVKLGGDRMVSVLCGGGGETDFLIDVTGYFP